MQIVCTKYVVGPNEANLCEMHLEKPENVRNPIAEVTIRCFEADSGEISSSVWAGKISGLEKLTPRGFRRFRADK